jgi:hypothetical protein
MMGNVSPETCWASYKHGIINFDTLLHLVGYFCMNYTMRHGSTNTSSPLFDLLPSQLIIFHNARFVPPPPKKTFKILFTYTVTSRARWPRGLRRGSVTARLLGLWFRIPRGACMSLWCECCMLSGSGLCIGLITHPEESYRLWCVWVWSWNQDNEDHLPHLGLSRYGNNLFTSRMYSNSFVDFFIKMIVF